MEGLNALWGLLGIAGFFGIIYLLEQYRSNKPIEGRGLLTEVRRYHQALSGILSPYASASFAKELLRKAYDSLKGDYEAFKKGERSDYLSTLFDDKYKDTPREECWAICFLLECIRIPSGYSEANAARDLIERQRKRIAYMAKSAADKGTPFPDGIVNYSREAQFAIERYSNDN